mgnify:CR=1 FL=1
MGIKLIDVKNEVLSSNDDLADELRSQLKSHNVFVVNIMASPGAGKTTLLLNTINQLKDELRIAVIEGDIESMVDAEKIVASGAKAVQIRTGGDCHLDAPMLKPAIDSLDLDSIDIIFIENIGNLVCPAEFDTGAMLKVMLLSVPEGDDKVLKYPLMFSVCDGLLITKTDCASMFDFDMEKLKKRVQLLNPKLHIIPLCAKTGENTNTWIQWLKEQRDAYLGLQRG